MPIGDVAEASDLIPNPAPKAVQPNSDGLRGDSWDLEPAQVVPLRASPAQQQNKPAPAPVATANGEAEHEEHADGEAPLEGGGKKKRRRRRRGRGKGGAEGGAPTDAVNGQTHAGDSDEPTNERSDDAGATMVDEPMEDEAPHAAEQADGANGEESAEEMGEIVVKKKRRRRGGRGRKKTGASTEASPESGGAEASE